MARDKGSAAPPSSPAPAPPIYRGSQLWQVPLFLLGLLSLTGVGVARPWWYDAELVQLRHDLAQARNVLQDPHAAVNGLTVRLTEALDHLDRLPDRAGEAHFLLGSTYLRLAEQVPAERADDFWRKARAHLEQAERLGVADSDRATLGYRLAKAWFRTGGELPRIIDALNKTLDLVEEDRLVGYEMLTLCYLRLPTPDLNAALEANGREIQLPTVDENRLMPARLLRGELLLRMQRREEARKVLTHIGLGAPQPLQTRARLLRAQSYQEEQAWAEAAGLWEEVLADVPPPANGAHICYLLGLCYSNLHRLPEAARAWERAAQPGSEEGQAARLRLAHVQILLGNVAAGLEQYESALAPVRQPGEYQNNLVPLPQAIPLLAADCQRCKDAGSFAPAQQLARLYGKLVPPASGQALIGQVAEAWAAAPQPRAQAVEHFREAAAAYEATALATPTPPEQDEWWWRAGTCYLQGQDLEHAKNAFLTLTKLRPPPARIGEIWYRLAEVQQQLHEEPAAARSFQHCIEIGGPFAFRAQYQLAAAEVRAGHPEAAIDMLEHLLKLMGAEPDRETQEKTLYSLAELYDGRQDFDRATKPWEDALSLYPKNPTALSARYRLALAYRKLAEREAVTSRPSDLFKKATAHLQKLIEDLQARRSAGPLSEGDALLLRQTRFELAECRFTTQQWDEAIRLYVQLANEGEQQLDGLVARGKLYMCYLGSLVEPGRYQEKVELARRTLDTMQKSLSDLDDRVFQGDSDMSKRAYWERWVKEQSKLLESYLPPKP